ncbi:hypothetical protein EPH_0044080 [Eimeria praecox]|uniref:Uncharacterized protein n=1 Tax=Eimeria praecox TaxID=51316 RepID=U6H762_9EIME|nr:hypothetical protein EPH_0044080 [Eimeria praecox]
MTAAGGDGIWRMMLPSVNLGRHSSASRCGAFFFHAIAGKVKLRYADGSATASELEDFLDGLGRTPPNTPGSEEAIVDSVWRMRWSPMNLRQNDFHQEGRDALASHFLLSCGRWRVKLEGPRHAEGSAVRSGSKGYAGWSFCWFCQTTGLCKSVGLVTVKALVKACEE